MPPSAQLKILYVSDSLGTPIHPRGIFNYSVSTLEILRSLGAEVTLVVEGSPGFGVADGSTARRIDTLAPAALGVVRLAEIYRYFAESRFGYEFEYRGALSRHLAKYAPGLLRLWHRVAARLTGSAGRVLRNDTSQLDWVPPSGDHLRLADRLLVAERFYSQSMLRAVNKTGPVSIDASGYDLAFVDTPHYAKILGLPPERVMAVVHDLIPLQDSQMAGDWRLLFTRKLEATLRNAATLIFVSETTRTTFNAFFPQHAGMPHLIVYPAIRAGLLAAAGAPASSDTEYLAGLGARRRAQRIARYAKRLPESLPVALALGQVSREEVRSFLDPGPDWNPDLPFFATVVSDEPRKNVAIFVAAAEALRDRANLLIIGQVDGDRYTGGTPERYPNLHFTGYVTEAEKLDLVRGSAGLVFASFSEGFGIPVVEGAVFGRPVICADIPVFREITGGLATYIDPNRPDDLVHAVDAILEDQAGADARAEPLRRLCIERYRQDVMAERLGPTLIRLATASDLSGSTRDIGINR